MTFIKTTLAHNQLLFIGVLAVILAGIGINIIFGIILLILGIITLFIPHFLMRKDDTDLLDLLETKVATWQAASKAKKVAEEEAQAKALAEQEKQKAEEAAAAEIRAEQARQNAAHQAKLDQIKADKQAIIKAQAAKQQQAEYEQKLQQYDKKMLTQAMLLRTQLSQDQKNSESKIEIPSIEEIVATLKETHPAPQLPAQEAEQMVRQETDTKQATATETMQNQGDSTGSSDTTIASSEEFKVKKHGSSINFIFLLFGLVPIGIVVANWSQIFGGAIGGSIGAILLIAFIGDVIYYLPTLIYHASFGGKFLMWLLNTIFSWTFIGWIILMVIASSRNSKAEREQEMLYHQRQMDQVLKQQNMQNK